MEALKSVRMLEKEDAEKPEKEALDFYRQLEEEENRKKVSCLFPFLSQFVLQKISN